MGIYLVIASIVVFGLMALQLRLGMVFRSIGAPCYREMEPTEFWIRITFGFALATGIGAYGLGMVLGR